MSQGLKSEGVYHPDISVGGRFLARRTARTKALRRSLSDLTCLGGEGKHKNIRA